MKSLWALTAWLAVMAVPLGLAAEEPARPSLQHRWVYLATNLLVDKNVEDAMALVERAAKAGYNGVVLTDSKFLRWDELPQQYLANVHRVRAACRDRKLALIACVCPIGYANDLLARDPNLAEGLPVVDAPFVAEDGRLVPADDSARLVNGGFEQSRDNMPTGWSFVDQPGKITFIDTKVKFKGRSSLRMEDIGPHDPQYGHGRACQTLSVKPFRYYHATVSIKTENDPLIRREIIRALGKYPSPAADVIIEAALKDPVNFVRAEACEAWGHRTDNPRAVVLLSESLRSDADFDVRMAAATALGETKNPAAKVVLGEALADPDPAMQYQAVVSLQKATGQDFGNSIERGQQYIKGETPQPQSLAERFLKLF